MQKIDIDNGSVYLNDHGIYFGSSLWTAVYPRYDIIPIFLLLSLEPKIPYSNKFFWFIINKVEDDSNTRNV